MEEWISLNEFMKRKKIGYKLAIQLIKNKEVDAKQLPGGRYKIKVGGDSISKDLYEHEKERRIQAETKLEMLKAILVKEEYTNENN